MFLSFYVICCGRSYKLFGQSHDIEHGEDYFINFVALLASSCKIRVFD
jgi:hypothetical protein